MSMVNFPIENSGFIPIMSCMGEKQKILTSEYLWKCIQDELHSRGDISLAEFERRVGLKNVREIRRKGSVPYSERMKRLIANLSADLSEYGYPKPTTTATETEIYLHGHIINAGGKAPWICPLCGTPYAPHVDKCEPCTPNHPAPKPKQHKEKTP